MKEWRHTMRVVPDGDGAKQIDEITIDAGLMTWPISLMAKRMYKGRDAPRRKILGLANTEARSSPRLAVLSRIRRPLMLPTCRSRIARTRSIRSK